MYLDADISYVNFGRPTTRCSNKKFKLYDVYNHGTDMEGILKVKFDRYLIIWNNGKVSQTISSIYPKIKNRKDLSEVKIRIGIQVIAYLK